MNKDAETKLIEYQSFGGDERVKLTIALIRDLIAVPTRLGNKPTEADCYKFAMLCKSRGLNPFEGDAFLIGYETAKDGPKFNLVTSHQAFLKRAELNPEFDGMESGVLVQQDGKIEELQGDYVPEGATLLGGWARVHFKTRKIPMYRRINLKRFMKPFGIWQEDPAGMICKTAEADSLRSAFPTKCGGLYMREELERIGSGGAPEHNVAMDGGALLLPPEAPAPKPIKRAPKPTTANETNVNIPEMPPGVIITEKPAGTDLVLVKKDESQDAPPAPPSEPEGEEPPAPADPDDEEERASLVKFIKERGNFKPLSFKKLCTKLGVAAETWENADVATLRKLIAQLPLELKIHDSGN